MINDAFEVAHYRGFTVVTARDRYDDDYSVMTKRTLAYSMPEFMRYKSPDDGPEFISTSYPTREAALAAFREFADAALAGRSS